jgi:hypothetical protein
MMLDLLADRHDLEMPTRPYIAHCTWSNQPIGLKMNQDPSISFFLEAGIDQCLLNVGVDLALVTGGAPDAVRDQDRTRRNVERRDAHVAHASTWSGVVGMQGGQDQVTRLPLDRDAAVSEITDLADHDDASGPGAALSAAAKVSPALSLTLTWFDAGRLISDRSGRGNVYTWLVQQARQVRIATRFCPSRSVRSQERVVRTAENEQAPLSDWLVTQRDNAQLPGAARIERIRSRFFRRTRSRR